MEVDGSLTLRGDFASGLGSPTSFTIVAAFDSSFLQRTVEMKVIAHIQTEWSDQITEINSAFHTRV